MEKRERFDLLIAIESELAKRADKFGILSLSHPERVFLQACWAKGALDCNGFVYFFAGPCDVEDVAIAFEAIKLPELAKACRLAVAEFPEGKLITDPDDRAGWIKQQGESLTERWDVFCEPVWDVTSDQFDERLAVYLKKHRESFDLKVELSPLL